MPEQDRLIVQLWTLQLQQSNWDIKSSVQMFGASTAWKLVSRDETRSSTAAVVSASPCTYRQITNVASLVHVPASGSLAHITRPVCSYIRSCHRLYATLYTVPSSARIRALLYVHACMLNSAISGSLQAIQHSYSNSCRAPAVAAHHHKLAIRPIPGSS